MSHWRIERFTRGESLWPEEPSATGRPDEMIICSCNRVDYGTICMAVRTGCRSVAEVAARTSATTTCGACVPVIERILKLDAPSQGPVKPGRLLPVVGLLALVSAAVLAWGRPLLAWVLPERLLFWDHLLRAPSAQQASGYAVLGLVVLALLLPLRRRLPRLPGALQRWRAVHSLMGLLAVSALVAHTGLRLGVHLNFWLSIVLLTLAAAGSVASYWPWGQRVPGGFARSVRLVHVALFWPALAMIGLHILAVYSF
jgi:nitrite reductase (NADH) large subunit